jgi:uncharacterized protein YlxW (UPF0749 family)
VTGPSQPHRRLPPDSGGRVERNVLTELFGDLLESGYAEAAARRRRAGATPPAGRMRAVTLLSLVAVGILLAVAYRQVVADEPTRSQVRADLEEQIHQRQSETEQLQERAGRLRDEVARLRDQQLSDPRVARQLRELEASTGLSRVRGDGVVVEVADGPPGVDPKTGDPVLDPEARILDRDLQLIANALWAAGAEAVAINDRRLTATSTVRSASGAILVNRQPIAGPYRIAAIGPAELRDRFSASATAELMRLLVEKYGVTYQVNDGGELTLPAAGEPQLLHARSVGGD